MSATNNRMKMSEENEKPIYIVGVEGGGTTFALSIAQLYPPSSAPNTNTTTTNNTNNNNIHHHLNQLLTPSQIQIRHSTTIITSETDPSITLQQCCQWLSSHRPIHPRTNKPTNFDSIGIACFGPLGVDPHKSKWYGRILPSSPKRLWRNVDILTPIVQACSSTTNSDDVVVPVLLDTDVNAPAMAEFQCPSPPSQTTPTTTSQKTSLAYVTIGTGVGVGLIVNSKPVHGRMHPEGGHVCVSPIYPDPFQGYSWGKDRCPYKGIHTVEGIASSVALTERLAQSTSTTTSTSTSNAVITPTLDRTILAQLDDAHPLWDHAANAIANLCCTLILLLSMEEIVLGGGIMKRTMLFDKIRHRTMELLNGYVSVQDDFDDNDDGNENNDKESTEEEAMRKLIRAPTWGDDAGLVGALWLAKLAYERSRES